MTSGKLSGPSSAEEDTEKTISPLDNPLRLVLEKQRAC